MNKGREVFVTDFWDSTSNLATSRNNRDATYIGFICLCKENKTTMGKVFVRVELE